MMNFKLILIISALLVSAQITFAQETVNDDELMLELRGAHSAAFGYYTAVSLQTLQKFDDSFVLKAGVQYNSIGRTALEGRPAYLWNTDWGVLSAETLFSYTYLSSIGSFATGAGVGVSGKWVAGRLGYYYRMFGGKGGRIHEPFNIYYELCLNFLPMVRDWDLHFSITNSEIFELERHYQPSFIAECRHYPTPKLGMTFGLGCKPAGMFHLSAGYYQAFINLGVCYRW